MIGGMPARFTVGLVVHPQKPVLDSVRVLGEFARDHDVAILAREADAERVGPEVETVAAEAFADRLDAVVSLGGDGTMLGAMRLLVGRTVPILGVNHGNLGFLVEVAPRELPDALRRLIGGEYTVEPHSCLDVDGSLSAFNDLVITAAEPFTGMTVDLLVNGVRYGYYRGDALIASTPIGSTAYNYAAGGPVISPSSPSFALTPVAPMAGISRSVIVGGDDAITLQNPPDERRLRLVVDGAFAGHFEPGATLPIRLHGDAVHLVRLDADTFAQRSRVKLSLLDLPLRRDQLLELIPPGLRPPGDPASDPASDPAGDQIPG
jgi:NAD+ kinase